MIIELFTGGFLIINGQVTTAYPMGITAYSLTSKVVTTFVKGEINISRLSIGSSYISNMYLGSGNASLQLNAVLDGNYWTQNVALFHQINSTTFLITFVLNIWNFSGNFVNYTGKANIITNYSGFGVVIYTGPTLEVSLPIHMTLFLESNTTSTVFGYIVNGKKGLYYIAPIGGEFIIGGLSTALLPNDVELVWGGPGGGSTVYINIDATTELYYLSNGSFHIFPETISVGLDTAETAIGIHVQRSKLPIFSPYAIESSGTDNLDVLWPTPPRINYTLRNNTLYLNMTLNSVPLSGQKVYIEVVKGFSLVPITNATTGVDGSGVINNISTSYFVIYYPGNFTISSTYIFSVPYLQHLVSKIVSEYQAMLKYLSSYNFKKALSSFFNNAKYTTTLTSQAQINETIAEYILAFILGILFAAFIIKEKT